MIGIWASSLHRISHDVAVRGVRDEKHVLQSLDICKAQAHAQRLPSHTGCKAVGLPERRGISVKWDKKGVCVRSLDCMLLKASNA